MDSQSSRPSNIPPGWEYEGFGGECGINPVRHHYAHKKISTGDANNTIQLKVACTSGDKLSRVMKDVDTWAEWFSMLSRSSEHAILALLQDVLTENRVLYTALANAQERNNVLLVKARERRMKILELGGEDPGST